MKLKQNYILVEVDFSQKTTAIVGDTELLTAKRYNDNYRERSPVIATILEGFGDYSKGKTIVCNYSHFGDDSSPNKISDTIYSIPVDELIIAIIDENGNLKGVNTNIICQRVPRETFLEMPPELQKSERNMGVISQTSEGFKCGEIVFWHTMSDYEIVYTWKGIEKRAIKVYKDEIVASYSNTVHT